MVAGMCRFSSCGWHDAQRTAGVTPRRSQSDTGGSRPAVALARVTYGGGISLLQAQRPREDGSRQRTRWGSGITSPPRRASDVPVPAQDGCRRHGLPVTDTRAGAVMPCVPHVSRHSQVHLESQPPHRHATRQHRSTTQEILDNMPRILLC
jgi:hypothetical protein